MTASEIPSLSSQPFKPFSGPSFSLSEENMPIKPASASISNAAGDTITSAKAALLPQNSSMRPKLTPPSVFDSKKTRIEFVYLLLMEKLKKCSNAFSETITHLIEILNNKTEKMAIEDIEKRKLYAEKLETSETWSLLKKVATAFLSALSLGLGCAFLATGGSFWIGAALIVSGMLSLINFICVLSHAWEALARVLSNDEQQRQRIATALPIVFGLLSMVLGAFGSAYSLAATTSYLVRNVFTVLQLLLSTFDGITTLGKAISQGNLLLTQADMNAAQDKLKVQNFNLQEVTDALKRVLEDAKQRNSQVGQIVSQIIKVDKLIVEQRG